MGFLITINMKSLVLIVLSSIWILGVLTPPIVNLVTDDASFISMNLNEEEPQEEEKKDIDEEKILTIRHQGYSIWSTKNSAVLFDTASFGVLTHTTEIPLPPPESRF